MLRLILHTLISLLTFTVGISAWDTYHAFANRGFIPIRRIFRIKAQSLPEAGSKPFARLNAQPADAHPASAESTTPSDVVLIRFTTDLDGRVKEASVISGNPLFHKQAVEGAYQMRFSRRRYRGYRVGTTGLIVYRFKGGRRVLLEVHKGPLVDITCGDVMQN